MSTRTLPCQTLRNIALAKFETEIRLECFKLSESNPADGEVKMTVQNLDSCLPAHTYGNPDDCSFKEDPPLVCEEPTEPVDEPVEEPVIEPVIENEIYLPSADAPSYINFEFEIL